MNYYKNIFGNPVISIAENYNNLAIAREEVVNMKFENEEGEMVSMTDEMGDGANEVLETLMSLLLPDIQEGLK
jgi:ABC-type Na+ transport system ATPase subunit NatA